MTNRWLHHPFLQHQLQRSLLLLCSCCCCCCCSAIVAIVVLSLFFLLFFVLSVCFLQVKVHLSFSLIPDSYSPLHSTLLASLCLASPAHFTFVCLAVMPNSGK